MKKHVAAAVAVLAVAALAGSAFGATAGTNGTVKKKKPPTVAAQLAQVKTALNKYQDVNVAKAAGYEPASPCEMTPASPGASWWAGAMGVHFVNNGLMKPGVAFSPLRPQILVYLPTAGGGFQLVAAEYFKPDADQNVQTDGDRPTLFGRAFDGPMLGHAPGMPIHYDLHVWLWKHNPSGLFAPYNPDASCTP